MNEARRVINAARFWYSRDRSRSFAACAARSSPVGSKLLHLSLGLSPEPEPEPPGGGGGAGGTGPSGGPTLWPLLSPNSHDMFRWQILNHRAHLHTSITPRSTHAQPLRADWRTHTSFRRSERKPRLLHGVRRPRCPCASLASVLVITRLITQRETLQSTH